MLAKKFVVLLSLALCFTWVTSQTESYWIGANDLDKDKMLVWVADGSDASNITTSSWNHIITLSNDKATCIVLRIEYQMFVSSPCTNAFYFLCMETDSKTTTATTNEPTTNEPTTNEPTTNEPTTN
ncbi:uncharacterized protein LOC131941483 [Physella acuta]|uniref:uncharacterized protein LOC131941483 n=1 Tax=Physella acuta TaxID=109671 RepID=UPI0027DD3C63|nr:uncharacterized protein LOC131941483 [Physella acuta]